jgi:hypothetical protein
MSDWPRINQRIPRLLPFLVIVLVLILILGLALTPVPAQATSASAHAVSPWKGDAPFASSVVGQSDPWAIRPSNLLTYYIYLPVIGKAETCPPIPGESYGTLSVPAWPDRPAEEHADLNLALRGYEPTVAFKGLVDYSGGGEPNAPQLPGLFADNRTGVFDTVYQVYDWNWGCNCRGDLLTNWDVTLAGLGATPGETIHVPDSGYSIGSGYEVLVLYATAERITLKYTRDDNVIHGYTLHVENVCVEPSLLSLYQTWNSAGRGQLPALRPGQAFGRARGNEIGVAIRDNGAFMDPRSRADWWRGR